MFAVLTIMIACSVDVESPGAPVSGALAADEITPEGSAVVTGDTGEPLAEASVFMFAEPCHGDSVCLIDPEYGDSPDDSETIAVVCQLDSLVCESIEMNTPWIETFPGEIAIALTWWSPDGSRVNAPEIAGFGMISETSSVAGPEGAVPLAVSCEPAPESFCAPAEISGDTVLVHSGDAFSLIVWVW